MGPWSRSLGVVAVIVAFAACGGPESGEVTSTTSVDSATVVATPVSEATTSTTSAIAVSKPSTTTLPADTSGSCLAFQGVTCDGWVTDTAGVIEDLAALESLVGSAVVSHGHEIAVVVIETSGELSPYAFAVGLGDTWGVGDSVRNDGIVVLVALEERRTEIVTGSGLVLVGLDAVAAAGDNGFGVGDFDAGIAAIIDALDRVIMEAG